MSKAEEKMQQATVLHRQGFNCAQAVALPFCEELGLDPAVVMRAMEGFGAGMGSREQTCGALSAVIFLAGLQNSDGKLHAPASKASTYALCAELGRRFEQRCGATVCRTIKAEKKTGCDQCICHGAALAAELFDTKN